MAQTLYFYPKWLRFWHWLNALLCLILIITGVSMQYSNPEYPFIKFETAVNLHNIFGVILIFSYLFFFILNWKTKNKRYYKIPRKGFVKDLFTQMNFYVFGIFKKKPTPFPTSEDRKFNPLQKLTYVLIMYLSLPIMIITGIGLLYPDITLRNVFGQSGIVVTDLIHIIFAFFITVFLFIHIYFATIGHKPLSNFKSMFTGWHHTH